MKNTTISIDEKTLEEAREYAAKLGYSFNAWVNRLIENSIKRSAENTVSTLINLAESSSGNSEGKTWTRNEIYKC